MEVVKRELTEILQQVIYHYF